MVLIEKLWEDVMADKNKSLPKQRNSITLLHSPPGGEGEGSRAYQRSLSMPGSPVTPGTPVTPTMHSPTAARKDNVWRSVFHPGSNIATKKIGAEVFDKPSQPNAPTVYDWLYSGDTRSKHQ